MFSAVNQTQFDLVDLSSIHLSTHYLVMTTAEPHNSGIHDTEWYREDGDIIFLVENVLFKISSWLLSTNSPIFHTLFTLPQNDGSQRLVGGAMSGTEVVVRTERPLEGTADSNPIVLPGITAEDFGYLMDILYNGQFKPPPYPLEQLIAVLSLGSRFDMSKAKDWAIYHLSTRVDVHPAQMLELAQSYNVDKWVEPAFRSLVQHRLSSLDTGNTMRLGLRRFAGLAKLKELISNAKLSLAFGGKQFFTSNTFCQDSNQCRRSWETIYWIRVSSKILHPDKPVSLEEIPSLVTSWTDHPGVCNLCYETSSQKVSSLPKETFHEEERLIRIAVNKILDLQKALM
ncbi:hypothetical protein M422DRAFT_51824 [Sphaerobolus stellatus SS14]|uniref:BTB domain-containing protein n=1 Tax=Sphaerobolus stellatus (strain SS14) TaxID=990650 RepID=A0A0C9UIP4_SPHS4|nr:hypothetical protein M422DRAFT_51824 [Sphaerobolus stellatus SS14]